MYCTSTVVHLLISILRSKTLVFVSSYCICLLSSMSVQLFTAFEVAVTVQRYMNIGECSKIEDGCHFHGNYCIGQCNAFRALCVFTLYKITYYYYYELDSLQ